MRCMLHDLKVVLDVIHLLILWHVVFHHMKQIAQHPEYHLNVNFWW